MNPRSNFFTETLVTIVLYETEPGKSSTYLSLSKALEKASGKMDLFFYDNSPSSQEVPISDRWIIQYEHDPTNGGVSKAYNRACEVAKKLGKKWLWLWDQDDEFSDQSIHAYQAAMDEHPSENIFAPIIYNRQSIVSPFRIRFGGGWRLPNLDPGIYPLTQYLLINTGLLISVESFQKAGGYDNEFPLDFSDLDFVHRLRKKYERFVVVSTVVQHSFAIHTSLSKEKRLLRYQTYLKAARLFRKKYPRAIPSILFRSFLIGMKLSLRHSSFRFIQEYMKTTLQ